MANAFAKKLRKQMTLEELRVWSMVRRKNFGFRFNRQEPIGKYIADFICHKAKLIIEIDGDHHNHYGNDKARDEYLNSLGWQVLRLSNYDVRRDPNLICDKISTALQLLLPQKLRKVSAQETEGIFLHRKLISEAFSTPSPAFGGSFPNHGEAEGVP